MSVFLITSYWLVGIIVLYWVINFVMVWKAIKTRNLLVPSTSHKPDNKRTSPKLTVVVAAKDEEDNIEACVLSMLDQDYPNYEFIAVDDRSTDRTPEILKQLKHNSNGRLKVIRIQELEEGWFGKNNAMREGVKQSTGDWFCFIDADCWQTSRQTLSIAMREALSHQTDFLTVTPVMTMDKMWERIVQPACALILLSWFPPDRVNNPERKTAYASGQFMLISRKCYESIGGHSQVKNEMNEDISLAKNAKANGFQLRVEDNAGLYRTRLNTNAWDSWKGWSRVYCGALKSMKRLLITLFVITFCSVLPWVGLAAALLGCIYSDTPATCQQLALLWGGAALSQLLFGWLYYSCFEMKPIWSITFPLGGFFIMTTVMNAILKHLGLANTTWRGTTYSLDQRVETKAN